MNELINLGNGQFVKVTMLKGERGSNIATVTKTATSGLVDTYTITLTDGSTTTFDVTNGSSIASIEKTSTQGLVDTYTITLTDGTVGGTFTVTNATGTIDPDFSTTSENPLQNKTQTNIIAGVENGATASKTYYENDIILRGDSLYKVTDTIAQGGTIADGVNITETTLGELIAQINNDLTVKYENGKTYVKENGSWVERSFGMPILNTAQPLHVFSNSIPSGEYQGQSHSLTFTATKKCYLKGTLSVGQGGSDITVKINDTTCASSSYISTYQSAGGAFHCTTSVYELLDIGDVVTVNRDCGNLHVFEEK